MTSQDNKTSIQARIGDAFFQSEGTEEIVDACYRLFIEAVKKSFEAKKPESTDGK